MKNVNEMSENDFAELKKHLLDMKSNMRPMLVQIDHDTFQSYIEFKGERIPLEQIQDRAAK